MATSATAVNSHGQRRVGKESYRIITVRYQRSGCGRTDRWRGGIAGSARLWSAHSHRGLKIVVGCAVAEMPILVMAPFLCRGC